MRSTRLPRHTMGITRRLLGLMFLAVPGIIYADNPPAEQYRPDPAAVQRHGKAYRYPQDGWIVLHIEGEPYERGYQHGRLLSKEIAANLRCFAAVQGHQAAGGSLATHAQPDERAIPAPHDSGISRGNERDRRWRHGGGRPHLPATHRPCGHRGPQLLDGNRDTGFSARSAADRP